MHSKSGNIEIMTNDKADKVSEEIFESIFIDIKFDWKHHWQMVILSLIVFIYCITNIIK